MTNGPTETEPTHEDYTPGPETGEYPSTLRIMSVPAADSRSAVVERAERWARGEEVPHVLNFEEPSRLRELLTERRLEVLESVMDAPPESIRALATRLDRDVHEVHDDLHLLAEYEIIHFVSEGRAKKPHVPYETVRIEVEIGRSEREDPTYPASG